MSDLNQAQRQTLSVVDDAPPTQQQGLQKAPTLQDVQQAALFLPDQAIRELYSYFGVKFADDLAETDWSEFIRLANMSCEDRAQVVDTKRTAPPPGAVQTLEPSRERPIGCEHPAAQSDAVELGEGAGEGLQPCCTLDDLHNVFRKWLGNEYEMDAIDAAAATAAAERLDGDPLWLLIVSGPGAAKTETVQALSGCGAHITSTIQSEGALLSATSAKSRSKKATGGLLRKIGERGILVIKGRDLHPVRRPPGSRRRACRDPRNLRRPMGA